MIVVMMFICIEVHELAQAHGSKNSPEHLEKLVSTGEL